MESLLQKLSELRSEERPFALATVVKVFGSASAKAGSKAVINEHGKNVLGWVGGGCAESFVCRQALEAIEERRPRTIIADLDDEVFGLGMPCGGKMEVFIEPILPAQKIGIPQKMDDQDAIAHLAGQFGFQATATDTDSKIVGLQGAYRAELVLWNFVQLLAHNRGASLQSLRDKMSLFSPSQKKSESSLLHFSEFVLLGAGRITEEAASLLSQLRWRHRVLAPLISKENYPQATVVETITDFSEVKLNKDQAVLIASHHKGDQFFFEEALNRECPYVGMIASRKRVGLMLEAMDPQKLTARAQHVFMPAGLDLNCQTPAEIALSVVAELLSLKYIAESKWN